ncbi:hypothetical protein [Spiroplasma endosymbiont of Aspidapion aeneum]|uniref:hypothetical protein n=1 Tax=Spiroplasma endosymbiont of Aspidapion aeneum TaxID=3066276 RepID=UPI00313DCAB8
MFLENMNNHKIHLREEYFNPKKKSIKADKIRKLQQLEQEKCHILIERVNYSNQKSNENTTNIIFKNHKLEQQLEKIESVISKINEEIDNINTKNDIIDEQIDNLHIKNIEIEYKANAAYSELDYQLKTISNTSMEEIYGPNSQKQKI